MELKTYVTDRAGHDRRYAIDPRKIEARAGIHAGISFRDGAGRDGRLVPGNEPWWRAIQNNEYRNWVEANYSNR